jgi:hypothetical protein
VGSWAAVTLVASALVLSACSTASPTPSVSGVGKTNDLAYAVVDTSQNKCYNNDAEIECPNDGAAFSGQDAQFTQNPTSYTDNGDGTVTDHVTGLMWQQATSDKVSYTDAISGAATQKTGGYSDWRVPTIKELYSLMNSTAPISPLPPAGLWCRSSIPSSASPTPTPVAAIGRSTPSG